MAQLLEERDYVNLGATELARKGAEVVRRRRSLHEIAEEVERDPKVAEQAEENQRRFGTLTPEELRRQFTI